MAAPEEFGGLVYLEEGSLDPRTSNRMFVGAGRFFPIALLLLAVSSSVVLFVGPIASAGASLVGSELSWCAVVSAGVASMYCCLHALQSWRQRSLGILQETVKLTYVSQNIAHASVLVTSLGALVLVALAPSAAWALTIIRALLCAEAAVLVAHGGYQIYAGIRLVEARKLMHAYDAVTTEASSLCLTSTVWDECAAASDILGKEALQTQRIHFLESQKAELAAEVMRLASAPDVEQHPDEAAGMKQLEEKTSELRTLKASHNALTEQLVRTRQTTLEQAQVVENTEAQLKYECELNQKLSATMDQMKLVLQSAVQARDDARYKYKMLKKSVTRMVSGSEHTQVKREPVISPELFMEAGIRPGPTATI